MSTETEFSVIGRRLPRIDAPEKVTGQALYGVDISLPRMLHGKILRSPVPHARITHIDVGPALRLPGVKGALTGEDIPPVKTGFFKFRNPVFGDNPVLKGRPGEKVRFAGDEIAAVAAVDEETAEEALHLIQVEYEELPAVFDIEEALMPGAVRVHEDVEDNTLPVIRFGHGDVDEAFASADFVFEDTCTTSPVAHCCLEPHGAVATWDAGERVTVWSSNQMPFLLRRDLADALQIPESNVRVQRTVVGGRFGSGMEMHMVEPIACLLAKRTGRPVRIVHTRPEEFVGTRFRHPMRITMRSAMRKDGIILARDMKVITNNGAYTSQAPAVTTVAGSYTLAYYRIPAVRFEGRIVFTNLPYAGGMRGYGKTQGEFANEVHMDNIAHGIGIDPVELRLRNANKPGDVSAMGWRFTSCAFTEAVQKAADMIGWPPAAQLSSGKRKRGVGFAAGFDLGGGVRFIGDSDSCGAVVKVEDDGTVTVITGGQEIGQGAATAQAMIVAEELGVAYEDVRIENTDTNVMPFDTGTHASRTTFVAGNAVRKAAAKAKVEVLRGAAELLEASPGDLYARGGRVMIRGVADKSVTIAEVVRHLHWRRGGGVIVAQDVYDPPTDLADSQFYGNRSAAYCFGAQAVEVEVDTDTGKVTPIRIVVAQDVGRVINPNGAEGQIEGALAQALGMALTEELAWAEGQTVSASFGEYKIATAASMPKIEIAFIETNDPEGPFGAKGLAELPMHPLPAAIVNAIYNATKVRIPDLPLTPERVLRALEGRGAREEP